MEAGTDDLQEGETALTESEKKDPHESFLEYCREKIFLGTLENFYCVEKGIGIKEFYPKDQENTTEGNGNSQYFIIIGMNENEKEMRIIIQHRSNFEIFSQQIKSLRNWIESLKKEDEKIELKKEGEIEKRVICRIPVKLLKRKIKGSNDTIFSKVSRTARDILHLLA